jgi:hypothetical protein
MHSFFGSFKRLTLILLFVEIGFLCLLFAPAVQSETGEGFRLSARKNVTLGLDNNLMTALKALVAACKVDVSGNTVTHCKENQAGLLIEQFREGKRDRIRALETMALALGNEDEKLSVVASSLLYSAFQTFGTQQKGAVESDVAYHLIEAVAKLPTYRAAQSVRATVHAAMLAGESQALYEMLDEHAYAALPSLAYPHLMFYGRLDALPRLKLLAASPDARTAAAAFEAPRYLPDPTAAEKLKICPWGKRYLADERSEVYHAAGDLMLWCQGAFIDALLSEGEKRLAADQFTQADFMLFRDLCFTPVQGLPEPGKEQQCQRNQRFLEQAVNQPKIDAASRGLALFAIYYQRRNAETMKIMQQYKQHPLREIRKVAQEAIESLKSSDNIPE